MALAFVFLLAALSCVHTASLPPNTAALDTVDNKDSVEETLDTVYSDRIRQTVLEGVRQLLDSQLAAIKSGKRSDLPSSRILKGIPNRKTFIPKFRPHPSFSRRVKINQESSISKEDSQNSESIKVLTDDSVQDFGDAALKKALDELLKGKKDILIEETDDVVADSNADILHSLSSSAKDDNGEIVSQDGVDEITTRLMKTSEKNKKGNKRDNSKKVSQIINDHLSKLSQNDDDAEKPGDIFEGKWKSTLPDFSESLSQEDDNNQSKSVNGRDKYSKRKPLYSKSHKQTETINRSKKQSKLHNSDDDSNVDGVLNISTDEKALEIKTPINSYQDKNDFIDEFKTSIYVDNSKLKHSKDDRKRKNQLQPSDNAVELVLDRNDLSRTEKDLDEYVKIIDELIKEDNKDDVDENINIKPVYQKDKPKLKHGNRTKNTYQVDVYKNDLNGNLDKYEQNYDSKNNRLDKKLHTALSNNEMDTSDGSWLEGAIGKKQTPKETNRELPKVRKVEKGNYKQTKNKASISREDASKDTNVITNNNNFDKDNDMGKDKHSAYEEENNVSKEKENSSLGNKLGGQESDYLILNNQRKVLKVKSNKNQGQKRFFQEDEDDATADTKDDINDESDVSDKDVIIGYEEDITGEENSVTYRKNVKGETIYKKGEEIDGSKKSSSVVAKKNDTKEKTYSEEDRSVSKKYKERNCCRDNQLEIDETKILQDLIHNKEMKKSFSFSLNFTSQ